MKIITNNIKRLIMVLILTFSSISLITCHNNKKEQVNLHSLEINNDNKNNEIINHKDKLANDDNNEIITFNDDFDDEQLIDNIESQTNIDNKYIAKLLHHVNKQIVKLNDLTNHFRIVTTIFMFIVILAILTIIVICVIIKKSGFNFFNKLEESGFEELDKDKKNKDKKDNIR